MTMQMPLYKVNTCTWVVMRQLDEDNFVLQEKEMPFRSNGFTVSRGNHHWGTGLLIRQAMEQVDHTVDTLVEMGSGWVVSRVDRVEVEVAKTRPLAGGTSKLPHIAKFKYKRGLIMTDRGVCTSDQKDCFYMAVAARLMSGTDRLDESKVREFVRLNITKLSIDQDQPVPVERIARFEKLNAHLNLAINVLYMDPEEGLVPSYASKRLDAKNVVVLILFHTTTKTGKGGGYEYNADMHYSLVESPEKLFAKRFGELAKQRRMEAAKKGDLAEHKRTVSKHICYNCHNCFDRKISYLRHIEYCHQNDCQKIEMPMKGEKRKFDNEVKGCGNAFKSCYMLFWDFEALQVPPAQSCGCPPHVLRNTAAAVKAKKMKMDQGMTQLNLTEAEEKALLNEQLKVEEAAYRQQHPELGDQPVPKRQLPSGRKRRFEVCHHKTHVMKEQPPFMFSYVVVDRDGNVVQRETDHDTSGDVVERFVKTVLEVANKFLPKLSPGEPMEELTSLQKAHVRNATHCYLCNKPFMSQKYRARDHDHLNGRFLGVAHTWCNLKRRERARLTCFAHNFSGYDSHFLVRAFDKFTKKLKKLSAIPLNTQKFKCMSFDKRVQFLDSMAFLPSSLASLVDMLKKSNSEFPILSQMPGLSGKQKEAMLRKGVYPYAFASSVDRLRQTTALPARSEFYSEIADQDCSVEDYQHAKKVWSLFDCKNMLDYTEVYIKSDVYLLADSVVAFRDQLWDTFGLDMNQYLSLPHMALDIMLKTTKASPCLLDDQEMSNMLRQNIRGGLSFVNLRHATSVRRSEEDVWAEEERRQKEFEEAPVTSTETMLYLDANNLYGAAMRFPMPDSHFEWLKEEEISRLDLMKDIGMSKEHGYILEVDLSYPKHLHKAHNSYPLAPHQHSISYQDLSPYSRECLRQQRGRNICYRASKLTSTFLPRKKYVVHGLNLRYYLKKGLKLDKIWRVMRFKQKDYIRPFIELCSKKRMEAKTETESQMWKLICNSVYGKLIERVSNRMSCFFDMNEKDATRHASSPLYKGSVHCTENLTISFLKKSSVKLNQCHAVGFTVLEMSKLFMQQMWYEKILPACGGSKNVSMIMSDTDSFLMSVRNQGNEADILTRLSSVMDFSNMPPGHPLHDTSRKRVPGFLKNEMPNSVIEEAVAVRSKSYAIKSRMLTASPEDLTKHVERTEESIKCKGVASASQRKLNFAEYKSCIDSIRTAKVAQYNIRSVGHINQLVRTLKVCFSSFEDKRFLFCPKHSAPYGSEVIKRWKEGDPCPFCEGKSWHP